jgi:hypothetical protein
MSGKFREQIGVHNAQPRRNFDCATSQELIAQGNQLLQYSENLLRGGLVFQPVHFVFQPEFPALQFGDFFIGCGRVGQGFRQLGLKGLVLGCQLTEMRLKAHAFLLSGFVVYDGMMTQTWGLVEP